MSIGTVYLIPTVLHEDAPNVIPAYVTDAVKACGVFFVENERTARRYLKSIWREMVIDDYQWFTIHKAEEQVKDKFRILLKEGKTIGIISEAGCPGIADPGQVLVETAQQVHAHVVPMVGPSSILLALMASGMNGQRFQFTGYLPIQPNERRVAITDLEAESQQKGTTQVFIETPYRNNQLIKDIVAVCRPQTRLCVAVDITAPTERISTRTIADWKKENVDIHKRPAIFLMLAGRS
ncbi:SAM-dependent methyltransferase [Segetibacter sp. 3557_3]|uniref:SAM-dependent methyltransferase n=1 Tax=Segetibacter sp. 3557_3 TaxID=2547429 RepID=UPI0010588D8E|nr:SAM-dependent methyltransferase [Segetibacter sp. 3557_3]TDH26551.1 SAM-dependent methyltransferase [Segetibacter sp. 3557_3]